MNRATSFADQYSMARTAGDSAALRRLAELCDKLGTQRRERCEPGDILAQAQALRLAKRARTAALLLRLDDGAGPAAVEWVRGRLWRDANDAHAAWAWAVAHEDPSSAGLARSALLRELRERLAHFDAIDRGELSALVAPGRADR